VCACHQVFTNNAGLLITIMLFTNNAGSNCRGYTASAVKMTVHYKQENVEKVLTYSNALVFTYFKGLRKTLLMTHDLSARKPTQYHVHVKSATNTSIKFRCFQVNEAVNADQKISLLGT